MVLSSNRRSSYQIWSGTKQMTKNTKFFWSEKCMWRDDWVRKLCNWIVGGLEARRNSIGSRDLLMFWIQWSAAMVTWLGYEWVMRLWQAVAACRENGLESRNLIENTFGIVFLGSPSERHTGMWCLVTNVTEFILKTPSPIANGGKDKRISRKIPLKSKWFSQKSIKNNVPHQSQVFPFEKLRWNRQINGISPIDCQVTQVTWLNFHLSAIK